MSRSVGSPLRRGVTRRGSSLLALGVAAAVGVASLGAARGAAASGPSLPRQFSVEVGPGGALFADGSRLGAQSELLRWAQRAAASARYAGAVVFGDPARDGAAVAEVVALLERAGFGEVLSVGRPAPASLSAASARGAAPLVAAARSPARAVEAASAAAPRGPAAASRGPATAPRGAPGRPAAAPRVTLASMGLHAGGLLGREPHRTRLVRLFEREFPAFQRCHGRASAHDEGASFGVDLLIPGAGGRAKVRETRTRLEGSGFAACMRAAFEAIRFPPPPTERPEVVSYSVLFKPRGR